MECAHSALDITLGQLKQKEYKGNQAFWAAREARRGIFDVFLLESEGNAKGTIRFYAARSAIRRRQPLIGNVLSDANVLIY